MNGLNSELTPAWRGREAVIHGNQPTCFYLVQSSDPAANQRSDETPEVMHTQVQSLKMEVYLASNFPLQQSRKNGSVHNNRDGTLIPSLSSLF